MECRKLFMYAMFPATLTLVACIGTNYVVRTPYMDEVFHVPQTQRYCEGELAYWDVKITTPPGFHLLAALFGKAVQPLTHLLGLKFDTACSLPILRSMNWALWMANQFLLAALHREKHGYVAGDSYYWSMCLSFLPFYWLYAMLVYTDMMSISLLLGCYQSQMRGRPHLAALLGLGSVLVRQTNVVWVAFILYDAVERSLMMHRKISDRTKIGILKEARDIILKARYSRDVLLSRFWSSVSLLVLFAVFVVLNGGIVVGDRSAHRPVFHGAQIVYLFFVISACFPAVFITSLWSCRMKGREMAITLVALSVCMGILLFSSRTAHPYLLADNRHISFYVWQRYLSKTWFVLLLTPVSALSAYLAMHILIERRGKLWTMAWFVCSAMTLVPSGLLEFRYFLVPLFVFILDVPPPPPPLERKILKVQMALYAGINVWLMRLFLLNPYVWDDGTQARIIW